jgi:hypothetical protein
MTSLLRALQSEWLKTRRTLALTLVFVTPIALVILSALNFLRASAFFFSEGAFAWEWLIGIMLLLNVLGLLVVTPLACRSVVRRDVV